MNRGWKFLDPTGSTLRDGNYFSYVLPTPQEKWSQETIHPTPADPDGRDCGPGRLHVMNKLSADYAPTYWWPWYVCFEPSNVVGQSEEKTSVTKLRLRRIYPNVLWRMIRLGWLKAANLSGASLKGANLRGADLSDADLRGANLSDADLSDADLRGANLSGANLSDADLRGANLSGADLRRAILRHADLSDVDLSNVDLNGSLQ